MIAREQLLAERDAVTEVVLTGVNLCLVTLYAKQTRVNTSVNFCIYSEMENCNISKLILFNNQETKEKCVVFGLNILMMYGSKY